HPPSTLFPYTTLFRSREARDGNYRDLLADKIAQAIVEQRHGVGAYRASAPAVVNQEPPRQQPPSPPQQRKPVLTPPGEGPGLAPDRKSTRLNSSHLGT